jgi:plastocyanin
MRFALLALALLVAPAAAQDATRIDIALTNFEFTPSTIQLKAGQRYMLHLTSSGGHNFAAKAFFAAATVDPADRAKLKAGRIELEKGGSVDIHLTAPAAGSYEVRCTHFLHSTMGMTGKIVVS